MLNYELCKRWPFTNVVQRYGERDTMLYALGLGYGADPMNRQELRFVYEDGLRTVPTMATTLGNPGRWSADPRTGIDAAKVVHGEQDLRIFAALPSAGAVLARNRIVSITDKGAGKGALVVTARELVDERTGAVLSEARMVAFLRGDGGYSAGGAPSDPPPQALDKVPQHAPDLSTSYAIAPQAALIYRLSGDHNPVHADPQIAAQAGFQRPLLHGLCTYGMAARAAIEHVARFDPTRLRRLAARFTAPVYPGERITFDLWRRSEACYSLRARVVERDAVVLDNGLVEVA